MLTGDVKPKQKIRKNARITIETNKQEEEKG